MPKDKFYFFHNVINTLKLIIKDSPISFSSNNTNFYMPNHPIIELLQSHFITPTLPIHKQINWDGEIQAKLREYLSPHNRYHITMQEKVV
jgi:hypothetical protein